MNIISLKWKIFAFLLGFCALLLVMLWTFQTVLLNDMYKLIRKRDLKEVIATVEKEIDSPELQTILYRIQIDKDITVVPTRDFIPPQRPDAGGQNKRDNAMPETITEAREFQLKNGQKLSLTFYALIAPVSATISTLRTQLLVITAVMLLLSVLLAIIIAKRVSKPIEDISRSARSLAKGDYSTRFAGRGFNEIVALSDTLNTAAVELGKVEGLRRELLANVSHDLRTPLALIYSYAEMMNDFPDEITPEQTRVIMSEARRLTTLISDVLDISKLESNMEQLNSTCFSLTENILETIEIMKELLKNDEFEFTFSHSEDVYIDADEAKIGRVFYNLLINAVNYSGDCRTISVSQTVSGGRVCIGVTDGGEGIAGDELPFIWDRYYKSGKKHKRAVTGTGLGLSIVKKILELHGGGYGVTSEVGKGSTFWFEMPTSSSAF